MRKLYVLSGSTAVALFAGMVQAAAAGQPLARSAPGLTLAQQRMIGNDIRGKEQIAPSDFHESIGAIVPGSLTLSPLPKRVSRRIPSIRYDDYVALTNQDALLVRPQDRRVVAVIRDWADASLGG